MRSRSRRPALRTASSRAPAPLTLQASSSSVRRTRSAGKASVDMDSTLTPRPWGRPHPRLTKPPAPIARGGVWSAEFPMTTAAPLVARLLVVDDEDETAQLLRDVLTRRGYRAESVSSGAACLDYLRNHPVDVVVIDVQMPGMSGIELCEQLYVRFPDVAPIVLTGYGRLDTAVAAIRAGAYDFLTKPATGDVLQLAIERALDHFALQREVKRLGSSDEGPSDDPIEGLIGESVA